MYSFKFRANAYSFNSRNKINYESRDKDVLKKKNTYMGNELQG